MNKTVGTSKEEGKRSASHRVEDVQWIDECCNWTILSGADRRALL